MSLKGGPELRARLRAIKLAFKPIGRAWAEDAVRIGRPMVPERTGALRRSMRVKNATQRKATVAALYTAFFIDKGTKAHTILPKKGTRLRFEKGGNTIFAKRVNHPRTAARPFRARMAREALRRQPMATTLIRLWNQARR